MPKYQVRFDRCGSDKPQTKVTPHIDQSNTRYVTYDAESSNEEAAYAALFAIPRLEGLRSDWRIRETVECDPPLPTIKPRARFEPAIAIRIIIKIRSGHYKPGDILPRRAIWAERLGIPTQAHLDAAVLIVAEAGYLATKARQWTYVLPPDNWNPVSEIPGYDDVLGADE